MDGFCCEYPGRAVIAVAGEDRVSFLQALISNDIADLVPGAARWAALLTPQGKYLCDFFVVDAGARLLLDVETGRAEDLVQRLRRFKLRAKVTLEFLPEARVWLGWGREAAASFGLDTGTTGRLLEGGVVFADPRLSRLGIRLVAATSQAVGLFPAHGLVGADFAAWNRLRIEAGVPEGTRDLVPEQSILLEAGFDELHGVSWTKGCYIGQELTARTKYRALIKKRLIPVRIDGPAPPFGSVIEQGGRDAGEMRSSEGNVGLALLRLEALGSQAGALGVAGSVLTAAPPDWLAI
jgi:folate-binding protein YgfZ